MLLREMNIQEIADIIPNIITYSGSPLQLRLISRTWHNNIMDYQAYLIRTMKIRYDPSDTLPFQELLEATIQNNDIQLMQEFLSVPASRTYPINWLSCLSPVQTVQMNNLLLPSIVASKSYQTLNIQPHERSPFQSSMILYLFGDLTIERSIFGDSIYDIQSVINAVGTHIPGFYEYIALEFHTSERGVFRYPIIKLSIVTIHPKFLRSFIESMQNGWISVFSLIEKDELSLLDNSFTDNELVIIQILAVKVGAKRIYSELVRRNILLDPLSVAFAPKDILSDVVANDTYRRRFIEVINFYREEGDLFSHYFNILLPSRFLRAICRYGDPQERQIALSVAYERRYLDILNEYGPYIPNQ